METGWERRDAALALDRDTLQALVRPAFPYAQITSATLLAMGLCNTNYKITLDDRAGVFVVRLYQRDAAACAREAALARLVHRRVPMPDVVYADVEGRVDGRAYSIIRWVEGIPLREVLARADTAELQQLIYELGAMLAAIASFTFPCAGFFGPDLSITTTLPAPSESLRGYLHERLFQLGGAERLGEPLATRLWSLVERNAWRLDAGAATPVLVHGDYKASNLLVRRGDASWRVAAVLDWEFASAGSPLFDIGILLRDERAFPPFCAADFAAGYQRHGGVLPADWRRLARLGDLINLSTFLTEAPAESVRVRDARALIAATAGDMEAAGWD